jgi:hypothetical protein
MVDRSDLDVECSVSKLSVITTDGGHPDAVTRGERAALIAFLKTL